jgi:hypothetical protein
VCVRVCFVHSAMVKMCQTCIAAERERKQKGIGLSPAAQVGVAVVTRVADVCARVLDGRR